MNILNKYTLETLKKNRTRTLVTIIGIILSVAMFTATTEAVMSMMNMMRDYYGEKYGTFHSVYRELNYKDGDPIFKDERIKSTAVLQSIGHSYIGSKNEQKPYIFVAGISENFEDSVSVRLKQGRMPKKAGEIVLSEHLFGYIDRKYAVGDKILLEVGQRSLDGKPIPHCESFRDGETLTDTKKEAFTVVGIAERPSGITENRYDPGFTAYTVQRNDASYPRDIYVTMKNIRQTYDVSFDLEQHSLPTNPVNKDGEFLYSRALRFEPNRSYLEIYNVRDEPNFTLFSVLMTMAAVLLALIMLGSVTLIHNAFSISVSERVKQFGILKSVGATKKQIMSSVLFEAAALCAASLPAGVIAGAAGISLTFKYLMQDFANVLGDDVIIISGDIKITPVPSAIIAAVLISFLTVLISAYIPARKAVKTPPIDAIRQSNAVSVKAKKLRVSRLSYRLFGFEGMLADKYYKRSKRKYRVVVLSLFVSVVLFISASAFCDYVVKNVQMNYGEVPKYEISVASMNLDGEKLEKIIAAIESVDSVKEYSCVHSLRRHSVIPKEYFSKEYVKWEKELFDYQGANTSPVNGEFVPDEVVHFKFINDEQFKAYLKEKHLKEKDFFNPAKPAALMYDKNLVQSNKTVGEINRHYSKYIPALDLKKYPAELNLFCIKEGGRDFASDSVREKDGEYYVNLWQDWQNGEEYDAEHAYNVKQLTEEKKITVMRNVTEEYLPYSFGLKIESLVFYFPQSMAKSVFSDFELKDVGDDYDNTIDSSFYIKTDEHKKTAAALNLALDEKGVERKDADVYDVVKGMESELSLGKIISVLSTGFIVLISLICAANAFNTISTNIYLRRREFASLRSAGMSRKGFSKMMIFESLLYGIQSLIFGLPVSCGVCYLLFKSSLEGGNDLGFYIPWNSVLIAVLSVFAVIFAGMIYSMAKLQKENTVDALKNDNI